MKCSFYPPLFFFALLLVAACKSGDDSNPDPYAEKEVVGSVKDGNGNAYPNTTVVLFNNSKTLETKTNGLGSFSFDVSDFGDYQITIESPLASEVISEDSMDIQVEAGKVLTVDFVIQTKALQALVVIKEIDIFKEIRNGAGVAPTDPNEEIFAANVFDPPLNMLTPINAPDGHQLKLSEWTVAQGQIKTECNGASSMVEINLQGMIPNGTYTLWCNFLNKIKLPGEPISFGGDVSDIKPLGTGTTNVVKAGTDGKIITTIQHPACLLTETVGLVLVVDYHINGNTFGTAHIPDEEDANQLLIYFQ